MRRSSPAPSASLIGLVVAVAVFLAYQLTFSSIPTSDGLTYIRFIESGDYSRILFSNSMLTTYSFFLLKRVLAAFGFSPSTLGVIQTVNAVSAALSGWLLYRVVLVVGGGPFWGVLAAGLLAASYGFWYFANGEMHHLTMVFILLVFYLLLRRRMSGEPLTWPFVAGVALLNVAAGFFHQEHFLFGFTAVALLTVGRPWREGARATALYAGTGILGSVGVLLLVGWFLMGLQSLDAIRRWYFWQLDHAVGEYVTEHLLVIGARLVKGQMTVWLFGTQVLADALRRPDLFGYGRVLVFSALTLLAYGAAAALLWGCWKQRWAIRERAFPALVATAVWLVSYPLLLAWYFPAVTEYYLKTLPPLVLLLLLGPIVAERRARLRGLGVLLLLLVLGVNFSSAIWPWYRYGQANAALSRSFGTMFQADDLFMSFESGIDNTVRGRTRFLVLKSLFDREGRGKGFQAVREAIETQLNGGGRVFAYNLVPSAFSLKTLNDHLRDPKVARYRAEEFQAFVEELRRRYVLRRVLLYWEEAKEPLYLFGERLEPLWEVKRGNPPPA